ncbi:uncharacterized protein METZ01_LOCUS165463, partial [marine metagenome]
VGLTIVDLAARKLPESTVTLRFRPPTQKVLVPSLDYCGDDRHTTFRF